MKDKKATKYSINDLVKKHQSESPVSTQRDYADEHVEAVETTQEELALIAKYNEEIVNLDTTYSSIVPMSKVLVRVFLLEPHVTENGLLEPHKQIIPIPSQNGVGSMMEIESPFPYANKAVVVAIPQLPMYAVQPGDIVQLESNPVKPLVTGHGANATVHIPASYMHPSAKTLEIPRDPTNKHYGYLLIPFHEISTKISNA